MNRELKFRTWDTENKEYSEWTNRDPFFDTSHGQIFFWERVRKEDGSYDGDIILEDLKDRFILQQYTGLKDATGKEIYEGDIIQVFEWDSELTNKMYQAEIIFDNEDAQFVAKELNGSRNLIIGNSSFCDINVQNCKVIGNYCELIHKCTHGRAILDNRKLNRLDLNES